MSGRRSSSRVPRPSGRGLPSSESLPAKRVSKKAPPSKKTASPKSSSSSLSSGTSHARESSATSARSPTPEALTKNSDDIGELQNPEPESDEGEEGVDEPGSDEERPAKHRKSTQVKEPAPPTEITYNINFFSISDMSKLGKKPQPKGSAILKLLDNITFARFERKVLAKFCTLAKIVVAPDDGEVNVKFQVPRQVLNYVALDDEDAYQHMVAAALRSQNPSVNLALSYSEDTALKSDVEEEKAATKKKAGKKSKVPSENDISPVNAEINTKIALLRTKYTCHDNDGSDFCWVSPEDGKHVALGHAHFNMWAAAWAHGSVATETPAWLPSRYCSVVSQQATSQASTAMGPTIHTHNNFTIPDGLLDLFRPAATKAPQPAPITQPYEPQLTLLPPGMNVGQQMPISTFCVVANLDDAIAEKFAANGYRTTAAFRFIELKDLSLIQFLPGEIAELREAVREWAVATYVTDCFPLFPSFRCI
ncbi:hypothetical protein B0H14DRAFT_3875596 [Mycena olivaceomarginata]|nr:hypothetical protein B0H14DRAFT_3875596 [Mycena olivaceomarginata]